MQKQPITFQEIINPDNWEHFRNNPAVTLNGIIMTITRVYVLTEPTETSIVEFSDTNKSPYGWGTNTTNPTILIESNAGDYKILGTPPSRITVEDLPQEFSDGAMPLG
jgi:hypothetical protein